MDVADWDGPLKGNNAQGSRTNLLYAGCRRRVPKNPRIAYMLYKYLYFLHI